MTDWREKAKELGIPVYDKELKRPRLKVAVLADIEVMSNVCKDIKITIRADEATEICRKALFDHVSKLGMKNITCEKWFLNCKRKGIVFKGQKNEDRQTESERREGSGAGEHVPEESR